MQIVEHTCIIFIASIRTIINSRTTSIYKKQYVVCSMNSLQFVESNYHDLSKKKNVV